MQLHGLQTPARDHGWDTDRHARYKPLSLGHQPGNDDSIERIDSAILDAPLGILASPLLSLGSWTAL